MKNSKLRALTRSLSSSSTRQCEASSHPTASLSAALQHYICSDNPVHGLHIHSHIIKTRSRPNTNISIKLLILHLKSGCLKYARQVFDQLPQPTLSAYNYLLNGYVKNRQVTESLDLVHKMVSSGLKSDGYTLSMILKASSSDSKEAVSILVRSIGEQVHAQVIRSDIQQDEILWTALIDWYLKYGKIGYARKVFDFMSEKNVVCSTSMLSGYMKLGFIEEAEDVYRKIGEKDGVVFNAMIEGYSKSLEMGGRSLEFFVEMQRLAFRPSLSTFASVIGACSVLAASEAGQQIHCQLMKTEFFRDTKMGSALVDMYSKCGRMEDAQRVFNKMPQKNIFSWTSLIDGYGKNGNSIEALKLFGRMQEEDNVKPNYITFLGALSACGHAGLVDKGWEIFRSMERDYSLKPKMEHYACMVDLLGRAGSLLEAWKFVMEMPEKPNSDVWAALLGSCRLHGDAHMANVAANELFKVNAGGERSGAYVVLSNTMAAAERWDRVSEVRELMKVRGVSKDIGCSRVGTDAAAL